METASKYRVKEITWPGRTFITRRASIGADTLPAFFTETYGAIYMALNQAGLQTREMPCAIYYPVDGPEVMTDVASAVSVQGPLKELPGFTSLLIPRSKALMIHYTGGCDQIGEAYAILDQYLADHHLHKELVVEEYFSDPAVVKDQGVWRTNIYYIVR